MILISPFHTHSHDKTATENRKPKGIIYRAHKNTPIRSDPAATTGAGAVNDPAPPIECSSGAAVSEALVVVDAVFVPAMERTRVISIDT